MDSGDDADIYAINAIIARQFESLSWSPDVPANREALAGDFIPGAMLFPSARPLKSQSVDSFVERTRALGGRTLTIPNSRATR